jgi:hypothetical protein
VQSRSGAHLALYALSAIGWAGCVQTSPEFCDVEKLVIGDVDGRDPITHCESFLENADAGGTNPMALAQACVLKAVQQDRATFTLIYDVPGATNHLRAGISGYRGTNNRMSVRYYAASQSPTATAPALSVKTCNEQFNADNTALVAQALDATPGCTPGPGMPCLTCNAPGIGSLICGAP